MRDSLLSQFQGVFSGACLGEAIGSRAEMLTAWHIDPYQPATLASNLAWSRRLIQEAEQLVMANQRVTARQLVTTEQPTSTAELSTFTESSPALTMLPLALFYHDQPAVFQRVISQISAASNSADRFSEAAILGQIMSLIIREQRQPIDLIPQVLQDLNLPSPSVEPLQQVQTWLEHPPELTTVGRWLKSLVGEASDRLELPLALYCFLSTPTEFRLSLLRFAQLARQTALSPSLRSLIGTLTGALSGLYNGISGLPLAWRLSWQQRDASVQNQSVNQPALIDTNQAVTNQIVTNQEATQIATRFLAMWSGVAWSDTAQATWLQSSHLNLTAAPRVIRGKNSGRS